MLILIVVTLIAYALTMISSGLLFSIGITSLFAQIMCGMFWGFATPCLLLPKLVKWYYNSNEKKE